MPLFSITCPDTIAFRLSSTKLLPAYTSITCSSVSSILPDKSPLFLFKSSNFHPKVIAPFSVLLNLFLYMSILSSNLSLIAIVDCSIIFTQSSPNNCSALSALILFSIKSAFSFLYDIFISTLSDDDSAKI